jgi:hypothetical protein
MSTRLSGPAVGVLLGLLAAVAACPTQQGECPDLPKADLERLPSRLSETGLYADTRAGTLAMGVMPYQPQFELWSDGASKGRWLFLPSGTRIDSSNPDFWQFPEGTRLWKDFTRDGVRVETRLLQKIGPAPEDWVTQAYVWNADQSDATASVDGAVNASGTTHDVPSAANCMGCHAGTPSRVLGVSAIQLGYDAPSGIWDLQDLVDAQLLSHPPPANLTVPGTDVERRALGYLHANCGHCHNLSRPETAPRAQLGPLSVPGNPATCFNPQTDFELMLRTNALGSVADTPVYKTAVGRIFQRGNPDGSRAINRVQTGAMPPLGTEVVHPEGLQLLRDWVSALQ